MITKIIILLLSIHIAFICDSIHTPMTISIDIEFCDYNKVFEKSICKIKESESKSMNRLLIDQNANLNEILIDKRTITSEKAAAIFGNGSISIEKKNIINLPYFQKSILIKPGEYSVVELQRGYKILIR